MSVSGMATAGVICDVSSLTIEVNPVTGTADQEVGAAVPPCVELGADLGTVTEWTATIDALTEIRGLRVEVTEIRGLRIEAC